MKNNNFLFLVILGIFLLYSCQKESFSENDYTTPNEQPLKLLNYNDWDETEKKFFNLEHQNEAIKRQRTRPSITYHPLLIESINYIAQENQKSSFIHAITNKVGFPMWSQAYVHHNEKKGT